jgi:rhodanese-related sulfurtransferase
VTIKSAAELIAEAQVHLSCLDAEAAKELYDSSPDAVILDVREARSAARSKLADSTNISRGLLEMQVAKLCPDPSTVILTHCGGGGRASLAAYTLGQMGYENVHAITAPYEKILKTFG